MNNGYGDSAAPKGGHQAHHYVPTTNRKQFIFCAGGIFVCYFYFGIMQEAITRHKYVLPDGTVEFFKYTISLVFFQCLMNSVIAFTIGSARNNMKDSTNWYEYALMSISYLGAMLASNHALQHVSYPTQVVGKSVKPIPVMILGVLFAHKRYPVAKYLFILLISIGVAVFMYKPEKAAQAEQATAWIGELLLLLSLLLDGVTGAVQDRVRVAHRPTPLSMMFNLNFFATSYLAVMLLGTGELWEFIAFANRHNTVILKLVSFSVASAVGQNFIFMTITNFGPLSCSIITTTRKFFTVLSSVIFFSHPLVIHQWFGVFMVFLGLALDSKWGKELKNAKPV